jgi:N utilization substance protein A
MSNSLLDSFSEFRSSKNLDREAVKWVLEDVFRTLIRKRFGSDENFDVIVSTVDGQGDLEILRKREIVPDGEVEDDRFQVSISEAMDLDPEAGYEVGETCYEEITIESFGRRAIMAARQTLISRILELEKDKVYKTYVDKVGELISGEISQVMKKELTVLDGETGFELTLPRTEMIRGDFYRKGDMVKAVIKKVDLKNNTPMVILSRTDDTFLERLMEQEVPEIEEGLVSIKKIVRAPGERAKVSVEAYDDRIEPVGACVGVKGSRIQGIVRELRNENIDVIHYTGNDELYIRRALTPAKVNNVEVNPDKRRAAVFLTPEEISKAIGKRGININLASKLTDYVIDVYREGGFQETEFDIDLNEFRDEIEGWMIDELKNIGCDTARDVLDLSATELVRRTDLEEEMVLDILQILQAEFDNDNNEEQ